MSFQTKKKLRNSGLIFSLIFSILFILIPYILHEKLNSVALFCVFIIFLISLLSPYKLRRPLELWIKLGNFLGNLNSVLILGLFFYLIIFPASIIRRFFKFFIRSNKASKLTFYRSYNMDNNINFEDQF